MDSVQIPHSHTQSTKKSLKYILFRLILALVFPIFLFFFLSFSIGLVAIFLGELSASSSIFVQSQCKIVSSGKFIYLFIYLGFNIDYLNIFFFLVDKICSGVDIRSSKVCELGVLNYKAKRVFYPFERSKFRCRYDYYWASVFKVNAWALIKFIGFDHYNSFKKTCNFSVVTNYKFSLLLQHVYVLILRVVFTVIGIGTRNRIFFFFYVSLVDYICGI